MELDALIFSKRTRKILQTRPLSPDEEASRIDRLRALVPVSCMACVATFGIAFCRLIWGSNHWIDYSVALAFGIMSAQNGYLCIRCRTALKEK